MGTKSVKKEAPSDTLNYVYIIYICIILYIYIILDINNYTARILPVSPEVSVFDQVAINPIFFF